LLDEACERDEHRAPQKIHLEENIMKVVITGATGFIGRNLADKLAGNGAEIVCLTRQYSGKDKNCSPYQIRRVSYQDIQLLADAIHDADYIFHVAGLTRGRTWEEYEHANISATKNLLQAVCLSKANIRRFIYVSSQTAAGPTMGDKPTDENDEPNPIPDDWYGTSKLMAEKVVKQYQNQIPVTIIRPPAVYGPYDRNFLGLFKTVCRYHVMPVIFPPTREFTIVHVFDLINGIKLAAFSEKSQGRIYFIGGQNISYSMFIDAFERAIQHRIHRLYLPSFVAKIAGELGEIKWTLTGRSTILCRRKIRDLLQPRWICSWSAAERDLGYHPEIELVEGIRQTIKWYREAGWI
jgi:nucleoside-diphosphate-sugar epimerase